MSDHCRNSKLSVSQLIHFSRARTGPSACDTCVTGPIRSFGLLVFCMASHKNEARLAFPLLLEIQQYPAGGATPEHLNDDM